MGGIFISYRRSDAQGEALHLFGDLKEHFGADRIFMDVATIEIGKDFRTAIEEAVGSCDVLISIIGTKWVRTPEKPADEIDFVHLETVIALRRGIPVVPVLVQGAQPPSPKQLPPDLEPLAWRNAFELRHTRWDSDVDELVRALSKLPGIGASAAADRRESASAQPAAAPARGPATRVAPSAKKLALVVGGGGAVAALAYLLAVSPSSPGAEGAAAPPPSLAAQSGAGPAAQPVSSAGTSRGLRPVRTLVRPDSAASRLAAANTHITLQYQARGDADDLRAVYDTLTQHGGWRVSRPEPVQPAGENTAATYGGVRYYFSEDSARARVVCETVIASLAQQGYTVTLPLWPMVTGQRLGRFRASRGLIEVWISPLPQPPLDPKLRPRIGQCGRTRSPGVSPAPLTGA